ncbi:MAG: hypothetical protein P4L22_07265 [Candidatus Babeliales bacterium]|nr:hypothetical protein [Candidatus Babeliales bacterium]
MKIKLFILCLITLFLNSSEDNEMKDVPASSSQAASAAAALPAAPPEDVEMRDVPVQINSTSSSSSSGPVQFEQALERLQTVNEIPIEDTGDLNINQVERLTNKTFKQLIEEHFRENVPLLIAKITTMENRMPKIDYYDGYSFNKYLSDVHILKIGNKSMLLKKEKIEFDTFGLLKEVNYSKVINPVNQQFIREPIQYYVLTTSDPFLFKDVSSYIQFGEAKTRDLLISIMSQAELSEFFNLHIPIDFCKLNELTEEDKNFPIEAILQVLTFFSTIERLNFKDQLRLAKIFFNFGKYGQAYDLLNKIIEKPEATQNLKSEAIALKWEVLSKISSDEKLTLGLHYFYSKTNLNYKLALELLERFFSEVRETSTEGIANAKYAIGLIYAMGLAGVQKNYQRAMFLFQAALDSNLLNADRVVKTLNYQLEIYDTGGFGIQKNDEKIFEIIKKLYLINPTKLEIGHIFRIENHLRPENYKVAIDLLGMILSRSNIQPKVFMQAQFLLAKILEAEGSVMQSIPLYESIINNQFEYKVKLLAYFSLGKIYTLGNKDIKQDYDLAQKYFKIVLESSDSLENVKHEIRKYLKYIAENQGLSSSKESKKRKNPDDLDKDGEIEAGPAEKKQKSCDEK